jgi:hypothetical protein
LQWNLLWPLLTPRQGPDLSSKHFRALISACMSTWQTSVSIRMAFHLGWMLL